jgi:regulator of ribonuclease activity A
VEAATTDLYDEHGERLEVAALDWRHLGGRTRFAGTAVTVRVPGDNVLVRQALSEPGDGRVLVVDAGGVTSTAFLGDQIGALAVAHGWEGVVVHGAVRDRAALGRLDLGVVALGTSPRKSLKHGDGELGGVVSFGGAVFRPGARVVVDEDGVVALPV